MSHSTLLDDPLFMARGHESKQTRFTNVKKTSQPSSAVLLRRAQGSSLLSLQSNVSQKFAKGEEWSAVSEEHHKRLREEIHIIMSLICSIVASFSLSRPLFQCQWRGHENRT